MTPIQLVARTRDEVLGTLDTLSPEVRAQISPQWLAQVQKSAQRDPWVHGFHVVNDAGLVVGLCGFKGPPTDGMVEIAYGINPEHQGKGYATSAARALTTYALESAEVRIVRAHTLPDGVASQSVLKKSGFAKTAEVIDPEDGLVWRFELGRG
ncbi:MAG TPA: GNAT family N-acetyltransferase [Steroidobacteraceae bacterium]|nr:GNAT family N-acetyltransferase [Steroidobacteraceae bacterium]